MYNMGQKQAFMRDFSEKQSVIEYGFRLFEALEPYEEEWGADICTQPLDRVKPVVEKFCGMRDQSKARPLYILRGYAEWCVAHGVPDARLDICEIRDIGEDKMRRQMVKVPAQLQVYLDAVFDPEDDETTDTNLRTFLWLAFSGMRDTDILRLRSGDVDFRRMKVLFEGAEYPLYAESILSVSNSAQLTRFAYRHDNYANGLSYIDRIPGDLLMRGIRAVPSLQSIRVKITQKARQARESGKTTLELGYYRVWLSGMFYRKWTEEQAGKPVDFSAEARAVMGDRVYRLDKGRNTQSAKFRELVRNYEIDYQRWKTTFE